MNSCRILIGLQCNFSCAYCCNDTMPNLMKKFKAISSDQLLETIAPYKNVSISGGEPLIGINVHHSLKLARLAKQHNKQVFMYTNLSKFPNQSIMTELIQLVDGWTIGVHPQSKNIVTNLEHLIKQGGKNIRLLTEQSNEKSLHTLVKHTNILIKPFILYECDISDREDWFQLIRST